MRKMLIAAVLGLTWMSCGPAPETAKPPIRTQPVTKEEVFNIGHQFYLDRRYDSAEVYLTKASGMDASYFAPLSELASMQYALGLQETGEENPRRLEHFRKSFGYFVRLEAHGMRDSEVLERLSELSSALDDDKAFVRYANKNAELYPYERQYLNLGLAFFQVADYQNVIRAGKEAIEKFKGSTYTGGFYRQLGRAYMKIDRDQTAERTFDTGIKAVDAVISDRGKTDAGFKSTEDYHRLIDDKIGMLVSLKTLHQTYRAIEKLQNVERQLKDLGYEK